MKEAAWVVSRFSGVLHCVGSRPIQPAYLATALRLTSVYKLIFT